MYKRYFKYLFTVILLFPIVSYAKTINYDDAKIEFDINDSAWTETELINDNTYIDRKWENDCGTIMTGILDIYTEFSNENDNKNPRKYFNYKNLLNTNDDAQNYLKEIENMYSFDNWSYRHYNMKFVEFYGTTRQNGINVNYDIYFTINNGYIFMIQYMNTGNINTDNCANSILDIVTSAKSTILVKKFNEYNIFYLLIGFILTVVCYEAYPFIKIKLIKKKYNEKEKNKMILWNSIVVGFIFFILTVSTSENIAWSAGPSLFYYYINKKIWLKKKKSKSKQEKDIELTNKISEREPEIFKCNNCGALVEESDTKCPQCGDLFVEDDDIITDEQTKDDTFICSDCGTKVNNSDKKCPSCGEIFDDDEILSKETTSMDQKVSDLYKLKKLLDDKIITKEEFQKEKSKILK